MTQAGATLNRAAPLRHVVSAAQFDRPAVDALLRRAAELGDIRDRRLAGRIAATLFYEPSTRTRLSFESAMLRLGGSVLGAENAAESSSAAKGETLEDSIRIVAAYADVIVIRHPEAGAAARAAAVSPVPVINAGDGVGEHPTQALLDLFCIARERGGIDGTRLAVCGDLRNGRTVHSLLRLLSLYERITVTLVAAAGVSAPSEIVDVARAAGVEVREVGGLDAAGLGDVDVLYQTRVQKERFSDPAAYAAARAIRVDAAVMDQLPEGALVLHPLPRVDEIDPAVDADPRAAYFRQAAGGVAVRMAVLESVLS